MQLLQKFKVVKKEELMDFFIKDMYYIFRKSHPSLRRIGSLITQIITGVTLGMHYTLKVL